MENDEMPTCPNCDTNLQPERLNAGRWLCPSCSRIFTAIPPKR
jgi:ribosomal protein L37AE/L43A